MTKTGIKEVFYLRLLPADEMADYICSLPYTMVETIIEDTLQDEDMTFDILTEAVNILKENMHVPNSKKALRKLLKVSQILGCIGYFDFGEWDAFRDKENTESNSEQVNNIEPPKIIKELIDAGQLEPVPINGKFKIYKKSMKKFIEWCFDNNYGYDISTSLILNNIIYNGSSARTINAYISAEKGKAIKSQ